MPGASSHFSSLHEIDHLIWLRWLMLQAKILSSKNQTTLPT